MTLGAQTTRDLRNTVLIVALLNLAYFGVEFAGALWSGSVALFADSVDFLEDAAVNLLIFAAIGWTAARRANVGIALAAIMLIPAAAFLWTLWSKFAAPVPPAAFAMSAIGLGALAVNLTCAFLLARHRAEHGSLTKAAFLSARNDALANVAVIAAALITLAYPSIWPDIIVGLGIAWLNLDAAGEVWRAAREEKKLANA
ncbi:MAG: cation transporter [Hyphomicrobiales bacterium]|nr:cation transporter [Hyphomicrobiales bacterium]